MLIRCLCEEQEDKIFVDGSDLSKAVVERTLLVARFDDCAHRDCILELVSDSRRPDSLSSTTYTSRLDS